MEHEQLLNDLHKDYKDLIEATVSFREQALRVRKMKLDLDNKKLEAYADGLIIGKNQTERDAGEYDLFQSEIESLQDEQTQEEELFTDKEAKALQVEYLRSVIRVLELSKIDDRA